MKAAIKTTGNLETLAKQINEAHEEAEQVLLNGLSRAKDAGELLAEAKASLAHGQWIPWVEKNLKFTPRQAQRYMKVAERWQELQSKCDTVSHLSFRGALDLLAETDDTDEDAPPKVHQGRTPEQWRKMIVLFWDMLAVETIILTAQGWMVRKIALALGTPEDEVSRILNPVPPVRFNTPRNGKDFFQDRAKQLALEQLYAKQLEAHTARILSSVYDRLTNADRDKRLTKIAGQMKERERKLCEQYKRLDAEALALEAEYKWMDGATSFTVAFVDARDALGIEPAKESGSGTSGEFVDLWKSIAK